MFGAKSKRIKLLMQINDNLTEYVECQRTEINRITDATNTAYRALSDRASDEIADLQYRYNLLESLLKQVRINVTLPARRG